jgi:acetyl esterase
VSKAFESFALVILGLSFAMLWTTSGFTREPHIGAGRSQPRLTEGQSQTTTSEPAPADPQVKAVLQKLAAAGMDHIDTLAEAREAYRSFFPKLSGVPEHVFRVEDRQVPGRAGNIPIRVYTPTASMGLPMLVFFHGGGFVAGGLETDDIPLRSVANRCECIVISVAYRLAPENKYPAAPEDAFAATKWVAEHGADIGGDPRRIAVGGEGVGGNLAAGVTLTSRERGGPHLVFQLLIYPMVDASTMSPGWFTEMPVVSRESANKALAVYLPTVSDLRDPLIAPIHAQNWKNLPPALIVTDQDDAVRDGGEPYADRLKQDGVVAKVSRYPTMIHGFFLMAGELDGAKKCIDETASALSSAFTGTSHSAPTASK